MDKENAQDVCAGPCQKKVSKCLETLKKPPEKTDVELKETKKCTCLAYPSKEHPKTVKDKDGNNKIKIKAKVPLADKVDNWNDPRPKVKITITGDRKPVVQQHHAQSKSTQIEIDDLKELLKKVTHDPQNVEEFDKQAARSIASIVTRIRRKAIDAGTLRTEMDEQEFQSYIRDYLRNEDLDGLEREIARQLFEDFISVGHTESSQCKSLKLMWRSLDMRRTIESNEGLVPIMKTKEKIPGLGSSQDDTRSADSDISCKYCCHLLNESSCTALTLSRNFPTGLIEAELKIDPELETAAMEQEVMENYEKYKEYAKSQKTPKDNDPPQGNDGNVEVFNIATMASSHANNGAQTTDLEPVKCVCPIICPGSELRKKKPKKDAIQETPSSKSTTTRDLAIAPEGKEPIDEKKHLSTKESKRTPPLNEVPSKEQEKCRACCDALPDDEEDAEQGRKPVPLTRSVSRISATGKYERDFQPRNTVTEVLSEVITQVVTFDPEGNPVEVQRSELRACEECCKISVQPSVSIMGRDGQPVVISGDRFEMVGLPPEEDPTKVETLVKEEMLNKEEVGVAPGVKWVICEAYDVPVSEKTPEEKSVGTDTISVEAKSVGTAPDEKSQGGKPDEDMIACKECAPDAAPDNKSLKSGASGLGPDGKSLKSGTSTVGLDGKSLKSAVSSGVGPDGKSLKSQKSVLGPDGKPLKSEASSEVGPEGKSLKSETNAVGADGKSLKSAVSSGVEPDGKPLKSEASSAMGPDGKLLKSEKSPVGPEAKSLKSAASSGVEPDGKSLKSGETDKGPDGKSLGSQSARSAPDEPSKAMRKGFFPSEGFNPDEKPLAAQSSADPDAKFQHSAPKSMAGRKAFIPDGFDSADETQKAQRIPKTTARTPAEDATDEELAAQMLPDNDSSVGSELSQKSSLPEVFNSILGLLRKKYTRRLVKSLLFFLVGMKLCREAWYMPIPFPSVTHSFRCPCT